MLLFLGGHLFYLLHGSEKTGRHNRLLYFLVINIKRQLATNSWNFEKVYIALSSVLAQLSIPSERTFLNHLAKFCGRVYIVNPLAPLNAGNETKVREHKKKCFNYFTVNITEG